MNPFKKIQNVPNKKAFKREVFLTICAVLIGGMLIALSQPSYAVRVSLKRVVFDGSKRSEILTIINNSAEDRTYRLGWRKFRMGTDAALKAIGENESANDILWADDMIRYAPRRVTIPAGGSQQVRLLFRRPAELQEAEYRSHLWIVSEAKPSSFDADPGNKQSVKLAVQPAISLPVFVRNGDLKAEVNITDAKLTRTDKGLNTTFTLNRTGTRSVYGDVEFVCTDQGQNTILHQVRGIAVYMEVQTRNMKFPIPMKTETAASCSNINIIYRSTPEDRDFKGDVMAQASASLQ